MPTVWFFNNSGGAEEDEIRCDKAIPRIRSPTTGWYTETDCKLRKNRKSWTLDIFNNKWNKKKILTSCTSSLHSNHLFPKHLYLWFCLVQNLVFAHLTFKPCDTKSRNVRNCWCSMWSPKGAQRFFQGITMLLPCHFLGLHWMLAVIQLFVKAAHSPSFHSFREILRFYHLSDLK